MKYPYGVGHIYSGKVGVYNPEALDAAPKSYKDIFDPKHGNKLGIIDIQYQYTLVARALAAGGKVNDLEPGKKLLLECKKAGARIYPTNEAFAQGLKTEEFGTGVMWKARVVQWQNAGISVQAIVPSEGALAYVSGFVIPKNAPNKAGSYAYLDAMLEKSAQEAFAIDMGYNPTVTNAVVAPDLNKRIGFTPGRDRGARRSRLRLHDPERRRPEGVVGQGAQGLIWTPERTRCTVIRSAQIGASASPCCTRRSKESPMATDGAQPAAMAAAERTRSAAARSSRHRPCSGRRRSSLRSACCCRSSSCSATASTSSSRA